MSLSGWSLRRSQLLQCRYMGDCCQVQCRDLYRGDQLTLAKEGGLARLSGSSCGVWMILEMTSTPRLSGSQGYSLGSVLSQCRLVRLTVGIHRLEMVYLDAVKV